MVELVRSCFFRIQPDRTAGSLAEFCAVRFQHQWNRQTESFCFCTFFFADQVQTGSDVAPLILTADLQVDALILEKVQEVHRLQNLVSEFREGNTGVQAAGYDIFSQHRVDIEVLAEVAQEIQQCQIFGPVIVVDETDVSRTVGQEQFFHLSGQSICILNDLIHRLQNPFLALSAWVADRSGRAADQDDGSVSCQLESLQYDERDQMSDMQAVACRIDAAVKADLLILR